jgi:hypothetical protein
VPKRRNPIAHDLRSSPKYRQRVVRDKHKEARKPNPNEYFSDESEPTDLCEEP